MRRLLPILVLVGSAAVVARTLENPLSAIDQLRAELHSTKVQLLQAQEQQANCQVKLASVTLADEQRQLEADFRAKLKPPPDAVFDWNTRTFEVPK